MSLFGIRVYRRRTIGAYIMDQVTGLAHSTQKGFYTTAQVARVKNRMSL
jgi:hypothetical protein